MKIGILTTLGLYPFRIRNNVCLVVLIIPFLQVCTIKIEHSQSVM